MGCWAEEQSASVTADSWTVANNQHVDNATEAAEAFWGC